LKLRCLNEAETTTKVMTEPLTTTPMCNVINTPVNNPSSKPQTPTSMNNGVQNVGGGSQS
jgi:hypothetical protein